MNHTRMVNESIEAYTAFDFYCKLEPKQRTVTNAYKLYVKEHENAPKKMPDEWHYWSREFDWKKRSKDYDNALETAVHEFNKKDQLKDILEFRKEQKTLAKLLTETGKRAIQIAMERLRTMAAEEIQVRDLSGILKAGVSILSVGTEAYTQSLALDELVQVLVDGNPIEQEPKFSFSTNDTSSELLEEIFED